MSTLTDTGKTAKKKPPVDSSHPAPQHRRQERQVPPVQFAGTDTGTEATSKKPFPILRRHHDKILVDGNGAYLGGFDGEDLELPENGIEVPEAPEDARQIWDG
ncbi:MULTISPECIES: hypothetical protein [unclassified Mesorhizobium]|uniref:hypothetical protein n=1 Tax=unclassified Mesorhizobium TaxID=325217 RepID=UPI00333C095E